MLVDLVILIFYFFNLSHNLLYLLLQADGGRGLADGG